MTCMDIDSTLCSTIAFRNLAFATLLHGTEPFDGKFRSLKGFPARFEQ